jgi:hypothetical protein
MAHAPTPKPDKPEAEPAPAKAAKSKVEVSSLTLSYTTSTCIQRLKAGESEVNAWAHNLQTSLQTDLDNGSLTEDEATAVASEYGVKAPKPTPKPEPAGPTESVPAA